MHGMYIPRDADEIAMIFRHYEVFFTLFTVLLHSYIKMVGQRYNQKLTQINGHCTKSRYKEPHQVLVVRPRSRDNPNFDDAVRVGDADDERLLHQYFISIHVEYCQKPY